MVASIRRRTQQDLAFIPYCGDDPNNMLNSRCPYYSVAAYCQDPLEGWRQTMLQISGRRTRAHAHVDDTCTSRMNMVD